MNEEVLLSTAYFPPSEWFSLVVRSRKVIIEMHENYHRQTYRNRCIILGANGPLQLTVPVLRGSFHRTPINELRIDDSKRWRDLHLRGITSAYATAPYFEYYFDIIRDVIMAPYSFLTELNLSALRAIIRATGINVRVEFSDRFEPEGSIENDYRYCITPKRPSGVKDYSAIPYTQVFRDRFGFIPRMSIIDVLLNNGPGTLALLQGSPEADNL